MWASIWRILSTFICCDLISAQTSYSENSPFEAVNWFLPMYGYILFKEKYILRVWYNMHFVRLHYGLDSVWFCNSDQVIVSYSKTHLVVGPHLVSDKMAIPGCWRVAKRGWKAAKIRNVADVDTSNTGRHELWPVNEWPLPLHSQRTIDIQLDLLDRHLMESHLPSITRIVRNNSNIIEQLYSARQSSKEKHNSNLLIPFFTRQDHRHEDEEHTTGVGVE